MIAFFGDSLAWHEYNASTGQMDTQFSQTQPASHHAPVIIPECFESLHAADIPAIEGIGSRFVALFPVDGQYAITTGNAIKGSGELGTGDALEWLLQFVKPDGRDVLVIDTLARRVWRADYTAAMEFLAAANG